jgi:16S rRNA processing protein RimM
MNDLFSAGVNFPQDETPAGSPLEGEPEFLAVGKMRRPHGVHGEMVLDVYTDFPERLHPGVVLFIGDEHRPERICSCRPNGASLLISFAGRSNPESAGELRNQLACVRSDDRPPLPEGEYYHHQLLGLQVVDETGRRLGKLVEILISPANDVYCIQPEAGKEILIPALKSVILDVDLSQGQMRVHLLPGLLPE